MIKSLKDLNLYKAPNIELIPIRILKIDVIEIIIEIHLKIREKLNLPKDNIIHLNNRNHLNNILDLQKYKNNKKIRNYHNKIIELKIQDMCM